MTTVNDQPSRSPAADAVDQLWQAARARSSHRADRLRPGPGISSVLVTLLKEPTYGAEIARRAGQGQGNVARWLPKLDRLGFVAKIDEVPASEVKAKGGGGRPAGIWKLTRVGRQLAEALARLETSERTEQR